MTKGESQLRQAVWAALYDTMEEAILGRMLDEPLTCPDVDKLTDAVYSAVKSGKYFVHGGQIDLVHDYEWFDSHGTTEEFTVWVELEDSYE